MSAWGREENAIVIANIMFVNGSDQVSNAHGNIQSSDNFNFISNTYGNLNLSPTGGIMPGDYIVPPHALAVDVGVYTPNSPKMQVKSVDSSNVITLTFASTFGANVIHPGVQQGPKILGNIASGTASVLRGNIGSPPGTRNVYSIQRVYGISAREANIEHNKKVLGINSPGWNHHYEYKSESTGKIRVRSETLVAMSKNAIQEEFNYPHHIHHYNLTFGDNPSTFDGTRQPTESPPSFLSNVAGANVHLFANAFSNPNGATIEYKWLHKVSNTAANTTFIDVATGFHGAAGITGQATNVLFVSNVTHVDGQVFMCHAFTKNEFHIVGLANSLHAGVHATS